MVLTNTQKMLDTSAELRVLRAGNGIKLVRPDQMKADAVDAHISVRELLQLPFCVYFHDRFASQVNVNDSVMAETGLLSIKNALGKSVFDYMDKVSAKIIVNNSIQVLNLNQTLLFDEMGERELVKKPLNALSIKMPWFNAKSEVIGLLGFSILSGVHSLSSSMNALVNLGLLNHSKIVDAREIDNVILTAREKEIAEYIMRECTAKEIAKYLSISPRTVEAHIENVKAKLNVSRKENLIEKLQIRFKF